MTIKWSFLDLQSQFCHSGIMWEPLSWRNDSYWLWWRESTHFSFCHLLVKCESLFGIQSSKSYQIRFLWKSCLAGWALSESKMEQKGRYVMLDFHLCKKMLWIILFIGSFTLSLNLCSLEVSKCWHMEAIMFYWFSDFSALQVLNSSWIMSNISLVGIFSTYSAEIFSSCIDCHQ